MSGSVNDSTVESLIHDELLRHQPRRGESVVDQVARSFRSLQLRRRTQEPLSTDLAAAEHYMYARYLCGLSGDPSVRLAPTLYGLKKRMYFALGIGDRMATTRMPVLPPNAGVERWGTKGAEDGLLDYVATTGKPPTNYGAALTDLFIEARRYN